MRVLYVWFTTIICLFVITAGWQISSGVVTTLTNQALGDLSGQGFNVLMMLQFVTAWWGPLLDIVVLLWAFINSQEVDPNSRIFG